MSVELTKDELHMIRYALQEMESRRREQAVERKSASALKDAQAHERLADKLYDYIQRA